MVAPHAKIEPDALSRLLADADAVVALNTSAEIEAAIAGRPVLTFRAGEEARGQEGSIHFTYLLEQNGGFVLDAATLEEHVDKLGAVLRGDWDPEPLRRFVERFVRPNGLDRPVTPLLAETIREAAGVRGAAAPRTTAAPGADRPRGEPRILVFTPPGLTRFIPDVFVELLAADATLLFSGRRQKTAPDPGRAEVAQGRLRRSCRWKNRAPWSSCVPSATPSASTTRSWRSPPGPGGARRGGCSGSPSTPTGGGICRSSSGSESLTRPASRSKTRSATSNG